MAMVTIPVEPPITEYLHAKAARRGIPLSGSFELTPCCNMACKMCYVRLTKPEQEAIAPLRTAQEWLNLGREARDSGMLYLLLTGGEPFLRGDFREIYQGLYQMGFVLSINTNGTMIDEETVQWLAEMPPSRINITLYGSSNETYARLCSNPQGFTKTTKAIRMLRDAGMTVKINCSLTPHNAEDADGIFAFAREEGLLVQATSYMFPPLRRDASMIGSNERFTPEQAAYQAARVVSLLNGEDLFLESLKNGLPPIPSDTEEGLALPEEGEGIRCRAGKCSFWVTWQGSFMPCGMLSDEEAVNVFDVGFEKAWNNAKSCAAAIRLPAQCAACVAKDNCRACAAMVYTETGNFHTVPKYRCEMTKAYPAACRQLEREIRSRRGEKNEK